MPPQNAIKETAPAANERTKRPVLAAAANELTTPDLSQNNEKCARLSSVNSP